MLEIENLHAGYGGSRILSGVSLDVRHGEIVAVLGRNGAGRSTLARAVMGQIARTGCIRWQGQRIDGLAPHEIARRGVGYVPETRDVFGSLTVEQNLLLGLRPGTGPRALTLADAYGRFAELQTRRDTRAAALSGGEQQLLAVCRALMAAPGLLIVDEPTEGLAPRLVARIGHILRELRDDGVAILLIEQKLTLAMQCAQRVAVMGRGAIRFEGTPDDLAKTPEVRKEWLEV
ncbi:High-affinity branched-chain amino acid transport ATP-binding protein LivF [Pandoraea terrae]|uniref:High-affinity branched-chain amino acid transport ATP-binding protein LivF n=1 Tax=Pandoraea terrae TaxID=1537710 RepID=A0A5E4SDB2_9BURK|nr:ABC transporter ATP-binding protein [Pandoraea terrae]VVD73610.1 High-affinity branched-chain amino acid transport ATP-binding protein LivF [Pandoraea terrae]